MLRERIKAAGDQDFTGPYPALVQADASGLCEALNLPAMDISTARIAGGFGQTVAKWRERNASKRAGLTVPSTEKARTAKFYSFIKEGANVTEGDMRNAASKLQEQAAKFNMDVVTFLRACGLVPIVWGHYRASREYAG